MATELITLSDFRPRADSALVQLIADAITDGKIAFVIGDLSARERADGPRATSAPPVVQTATLLREGDVWTFTYRQRRVCVIDGKGVRYLATLLENPGFEIHALDLVATENGGCSRVHSSAADAGPVLDSEAKRAYKARLGDLRDELEQAEAFNDHERTSRASEEIDFLVRELAGAVGLRGRDRKACSSAERARVNVTRAVRGLLKRVAEHDAPLGRELQTTIRTGIFCAYEPDPRASLSWRVERRG